MLEIHRQLLDYFLDDDIIYNFTYNIDLDSETSSQLNELCRLETLTQTALKETEINQPTSVGSSELSQITSFEPPNYWFNGQWHDKINPLL